MGAYYDLLDTHTGRWSLSLATDKSDRLGLETFTEPTAPDYSVAGAPTGETSTHALFASGDYLNWATAVSDTVDQGTYIIWYKGTNTGSSGGPTGVAPLICANISTEKGFVTGINDSGTVSMSLGSGYSDVHGTISVDDDAWHMISFRFERNATIDGWLYVDGVLDNNGSGTLPGNTNPPLRIMSEQRWGKFNIGGVAEVASLSTELTTAQMLALYEAGTADIASGSYGDGIGLVGQPLLTG